MIKSKLRGHDIELLNGEWVYSDTREPTAKTHQNRKCGYCDLQSTAEGHDGCLGTLRGIMNACCGHGQPNESYVQFLDGFSIHGEGALDLLLIVKKYSHRTNRKD